MINVVVKEFPKALELNSILHDRVYENILNNEKRHHNSLGGRRTGFNLHEQNFKEIDVLISWIRMILPDISKNFALKTYDEETIFGYDLHRFEIVECWGVYYNRGESLIQHNHFPYSLSFVYYVKTPTGTAPIIIEDHTYVAKEGQCIFFLASQYHNVGSNKCDGRCAIIGNVSYRF
jgi:hypothetical protein